MDGTEAAKQILRKHNLPIVFLASHSEKEYVERIKGIAGYGYPCGG
jgi:CheY-like chemotaxis protein